MSTTPMKIRDEVFGSTVITKESTEHNRVLEALRRSEENYRSLIELSPDSILTMNVKGMITSINPAFSHLTGFSKNEIIGKHFTKMGTMRVMDLPKYLKLFKAFILGKKMEKYEFVYLHKDKTQRWGEAYINLLKENGKKIGFQLFLRDITKHKKAEAALKRYSENLEELVEEKTGKLRESEMLYRSLVETSPEAITVTDLEGKLIMSSMQAARLYGFESMEDMLSTGKSAFDFVIPADRQRALENAMKVLETGSVRAVAYTMLRKDGTSFPAELSASLIKDPEGKPKAFMGIVRDLSEYKRLEEQLLETKRMATIGETAAIVGQDLRNPLQAIVLTIYLITTKLNKLQSEFAEKDELIKYLDTVEEQVRYMDKIISDLQRYAEPIRLKCIETNIHQLIRDTISAMNVPETVNVSLVVSEGLRLMVDPKLMRHIFYNLFLNAIQAMPDRGKLMIKAYKTRDHTIIKVKDTGVGIPEEKLPKLFQPLFSTKAKGQGFGLPICKRIIDAHGGEILVESEVGKGTTITVKIPL